MIENESEDGILCQKNGKPVPLAGVDVHADIVGRGAKVKISQRFINTEQTPIEAVYKFPLPENAAVCGFRALIDGRIVDGKIEEKEKAFEIYDNALSYGQRAQLMDEERPNIFTLSVGNINPGGNVTIEITYVMLLDSYNSEVRFYLPTTISPRFTPETQKDVSGIPVSDIVNPPFAFNLPYGLAININIHDRKAISSIESPSHTINTRFDNDTAVVTFSAGRAEMDRDFVLNVAYEKMFGGTAYTSIVNGERFIQVDLTPEEGNQSDRSVNTKQGREIIFVLDCSGSMQGESISEAKRALEILVRALSAELSFNIYRFGSSFHSLYRQSKPYNEKRMKEALKYLSETAADMGGTDVLAPLEDIVFGKEPANGCRRDVILLTDGEISNEDDVMELVRRHRHTTVLSTVGIGSGPNEFLIRGAARIAGGSSEMIAPKERIEPKVLRLFQRAMAGRITGLKIECGVALEQAPADTAAYANQGTSILARIKDGDLKSKSVTIRQFNRKGKSLKEWNLELEEVNDSETPLSKLWAREKIREIEEVGGLPEGSRQKTRIDGRKQTEAVEISCKYGVISRSTSFVGIEKKQDAEKEIPDMVLRVIPACVTDGWHGLRLMPDLSLSMRSIPQFSRRSVDPYSINHVAEARASEAESLAEVLSRLNESVGNRPPYKPLTIASDAIQTIARQFRKKDDALFDILALQRSGGGFEMGRSINDLLNMDISGWKSIADCMNVKNHQDIMVMLVTAVILMLLEVKFGARKSEWEGIVSKSHIWLKEQVALVNPKVEGETLETWAGTFVRDRLNMQKES